MLLTQNRVAMIARTGSIEAVEAMDGGERALLLRHLAQAHPEVVAAGVEWLKQWRADCAERRRKSSRRREHDRRGRRREIKVHKLWFDTTPNT